MSVNYIKDYVDVVKQHANDEDTYSSFTTATVDRDQHDYERKIAEEIEAHKLRMQELADERNQKREALQGLLRFKNAAARIQSAVSESVKDQKVIDLEKRITSEVSRLEDNCDVNLDDDETYALLFSETYMPEQVVDVKTKSDYLALVKKIEGNNYDYAKKAAFLKIGDRYRALQDEPYGPKYAATINAGFLEIDDMIRAAVEEFDIPRREVFVGSFSSFSLNDRGSLAERWTRAIRKIAANELFMDMKKFQLDTHPQITPEYIGQIKALDFSEKRFRQVNLPSRADRVVPLQTAFVEALENGTNYRSFAREISEISQELQNSSYVINGPF